MNVAARIIGAAKVPVGTPGQPVVFTQVDVLEEFLTLIKIPELGNAVYTVADEHLIVGS